MKLNGLFPAENLIFRNSFWLVIWEKSSTYKTATVFFHLENWKKRSMTVQWVVSGGYVRYVMCRKGSCWCLSKGGHCQSYTVEPTWNAKQIPTESCQTTKSKRKKKQKLMAGFIGISTNFTRFRISFSSHSTWFSAGKFSKTFEHSMKGCVSRFAFCFEMP